MDRTAREAVDRAAHARMRTGPIVTAIVQRDGFGSVPLAMARALAIHAATAAVMTALLLTVGPASNSTQVLFVGGIGLAAALLCRLPDWNWHGYSTSYALVSAADHIVAALLTGMVLGAIV